MAHLEKFKKSGLGQILAHVRRGTSEEILDRQYSNENIDSDKSIFNQNLHERKDGLSDYEYIMQRCELYNVLNRKDVNYMGGWAITLPESLKNSSKDQQDLFFEHATWFLENRYGYDNVAYAYVHWDETTPHLHAGITPCFYDEEKQRNKCSFKEFFSRKDYQTFHEDLSNYMEKAFGYDIGIYDKTEGKKASNKTIKELKQETHQKEKELSQLREKVALREREIQEQKQEVELWKNKAEEESKKALSNRREADRQLGRLEKAKQLEGELTFAQKSGLKAIDRGMLSDEIQAEIQRGVEEKLQHKADYDFKRNQELLQLRKETAQQKELLHSYKKENMNLKNKIFQSENNNDKETISSLLEENKNLRQENGLLRKALGRFVYEVTRTALDFANEILGRMPKAQRKALKESYDETKQFMKSKENQAR